MPHLHRPRKPRIFWLISNKKSPHPEFSSNLAPSDFFLFGIIKTVLMGAEFKNEQGPFEWRAGR
jgi:hypothetical protein